MARALNELMETREPRRGRLLVWRGAPGTGKTWALRALAGAWREWCGLHYVLDPGRLLSADPRYICWTCSATTPGRAGGCSCSRTRAS